MTRGQITVFFFQRYRGEYGDDREYDKEPHHGYHPSERHVRVFRHHVLEEIVGVSNLLRDAVDDGAHAFDFFFKRGEEVRERRGHHVVAADVGGTFGSAALGRRGEGVVAVAAIELPDNVLSVGLDRHEHALPR